MKLQIKVTEKHIRNGKPCSTLNCPIALAVLQELNKWWNPFKRFSVMVNFVEVIILNRLSKTSPIIAKLPEAAVNFIGEFDFKTQRQGFYPFEFELDFM